MITVRPSAERGHANHGWLDTHHTFSFAEYRDPEHMGFRRLRVLNEDRVAPGQGFGTHGHRNMEIVSIVLEGTMEHRDSLGNGSRLVPGEVQRMTAGSGVTHSEFNASPTEPLHFLQIWIHPEKDELPPSYEQRAFAAEEKRDRLRLVVSPEAENGSLKIHQDVRLYLGELSAGARVSHDLAPGRAGWLQVIRGTVQVEGETLAAGDGAAIEDVSRFELVGADEVTVLFFDLG